MGKSSYMPLDLMSNRRRLTKKRKSRLSQSGPRIGPTSTIARQATRSTIATAYCSSPNLRDQTQLQPPPPIIIDNLVGQKVQIKNTNKPTNLMSKLPPPKFRPDSANVQVAVKHSCSINLAVMQEAVVPARNFHIKHLLSRQVWTHGEVKLYTS